MVDFNGKEFAQSLFVWPSVGSSSCSSANFCETVRFRKMIRGGGQSEGEVQGELGETTSIFSGVQLDAIGIWVLGGAVPVASESIVTELISQLLSGVIIGAMVFIQLHPEVGITVMTKNP